MKKYLKFTPMPHQQRIIDLNPKKAILNWETRVAKSLPACHWIDHPCRSGNTYIVATKSNLKEWQDMGTDAKVITKDSSFLKEEFVNPTAMVIDEGHFFASPLFVRRGKGASARAKKLYDIVRTYPDMDILILTATPVRQDAWSVHTLLCYMGIYYDWKQWRDEFFQEVKAYFIRKVPGRWTPDSVWEPRNDWRTRMKKYLEMHTDIVALSDIVENLPEAKTEIVRMPLRKYQKPTDEIVTWVHEHRHEQHGKAEWISELGFKKLIVVAHFTGQIDELTLKLSKEKPVFVLDGRTKDPDSVKKEAQESEECYFIVQASMGFGFDGYMFGGIVFASMSHSNVDHTQMFGRLRHPKYLNPAVYYYLIGGRWDQRIYDDVQAGKSFNPHFYIDEDNRIARASEEEQAARG